MVANSLFLSLSLSLLNGVLYFASMKYAWKKSNKVFFSALYGNLAWKFVVASSAAAFIFGNPNFHFALALVLLVLATFVFTLISILILQKERNVYGF